MQRTRALLWKCTRNSSHTDVKSQSWLDNQQKHVGLTWQKYQSSSQTLTFCVVYYFSGSVTLAPELSHEVVTINPRVLFSNIYLHLWSDWVTGFTQWWWKSQTYKATNCRKSYVLCIFLFVWKLVFHQLKWESWDKLRK